MKAAATPFFAQLNADQKRELKMLAHLIGLGKVVAAALDLRGLCTADLPERRTSTYRRAPLSVIAVSPSAICASTSPTPAECLKPCPEQGEATMMRSLSGWRSMMKRASVDAGIEANLGPDRRRHQRRKVGRDIGLVHRLDFRRGHRAIDRLRRGLVRHIARSRA